MATLDYCSVAREPPNECPQTILCDTHMQTKYIYKAWERTPQFFRELPRNKAWERTPQNFPGFAPLMLGNVPLITISAWERTPRD